MTWLLRPIAQFARSCLPIRSRKVIHVLLLVLVALESSLSQLTVRVQSLEARGQLILLPGGRQTGRTGDDRAQGRPATTTFKSACNGGCQPHGTCNEEIGRFVHAASSMDVWHAIPPAWPWPLPAAAAARRQRITLQVLPARHACVRMLACVRATCMCGCVWPHLRVHLQVRVPAAAQRRRLLSAAERGGDGGAMPLLLLPAQNLRQGGALPQQLQRPRHMCGGLLRVHAR